MLHAALRAAGFADAVCAAGSTRVSSAVGTLEDRRRSGQIALIGGPDRRLADITAANRDDHERRHRAEAENQAPQPARMALGQHRVEPEHEQIRHADRRVPGRAPHRDAGGLVAAALEPREFSQKRHRDRQIDADAQSHHEARTAEHPRVRRERAGDRREHEEEHVGHEDAIAADLVGEIAAEERADDRAERDRRCDEARARRREREFAGDVLDAEGEGAEIVGIEEHAAKGDRDDHAGVAPDGGAAVDEVRYVGGAADDGSSVAPAEATGAWTRSGARAADMGLTGEITKVVEATIARCYWRGGRGQIHFCYLMTYDAAVAVRGSADATIPPCFLTPDAMPPLSEHQTAAVAVIGGGPAGLMAAEALATGGVRRRPVRRDAVGRSQVSDGRQGRHESDALRTDRAISRRATASARAQIAPLLRRFDAAALRAWVHGLGIETFVGSSGRVFPTDMKAAPLLRAWLHRLREAGVRFHMRHRWLGWSDEALRPCASPRRKANDGRRRCRVLALGGASWPRLGSDGAWVPHLEAHDVHVSPFAARRIAVSISTGASISAAASRASR